MNPKPLIVVGDFNIHVDDPDDASAKAFINLLPSSGLQQHVTGATQKKGHTLDLVITREANPPVIGNLSVIDGISDHSAILDKVHLHRPQLGPK